MRMNQDERRFDFHGLGAALKRAREEKGWTQAYVAELVDRDSRTIMNIENKGQYPSFDLFVKLITMFDVSVDQFIHADGGARSSSCRKHIDVLLNSMNEKILFFPRLLWERRLWDRNCIYWRTNWRLNGESGAAWSSFFRRLRTWQPTALLSFPIASSPHTLW